MDALDSDPFDLMKTESDIHGSSDDEEKKSDRGADKYDEVDDDILEKKKNRAIIDRVKNMISVVSCSRTSTLQGYSSIHAVVQFTNDGNMDCVKENVRLHFTFSREPQHDNHQDNEEKVALLSELEEDTSQQNRKRKRLSEDEESVDEGSRSAEVDQSSGPFKPKTVITYNIDYSVDYGQMKSLLGVDVYAFGEHPSVEEAIPIIDDAGEEDEPSSLASAHMNVSEGEVADDSKKKIKPTEMDNNKFEEVEMSDQENDYEMNEEPIHDRFGTFVQPEHVVDFLNRTSMDLNEQSVFYFLLTFPFCEHEWDISGFLLSMLGDADDDK